MQGLERPPRWAIVALVVLVVANAALLTYLFVLRSAPADPRAGSPAPAGAQDTTSLSESAPPPAETALPESPVLAVYGDGYTTGSSLGGEGDAGWPALVAQRLGFELRLAAVSMAGYAAEGLTGETFPELVAANPFPDADVVVVFGSRNDGISTPEAVEEGAIETLRHLRAAAPGAQLVIIGPAWSDANPPAALAELAEAVERAATNAGAIYVDPLEEGWFAEPETLIAPDGISPTDAGHLYLADLIAPLVLDAATAVGQAPA